jgi:acyl dehydratase
MPINPDAVGSESDPTEIAWTSTDCLLYALSVGAGVADPTGFELEFTTENTNGLTQKVLPTQAVVLGMRQVNPGAGGGGGMSKLGDFNPAMLVHGEQGITLHKPLPVEGRATVKNRIAAIYDKGKAAVVVLEAIATDLADGQPLYTSTMSAFIRGEGGWGGDRGPSGPRNVAPDRSPDHVVSYPTRHDQALLYRLNGDRNPLHSDPSFAKLGGFDTPILHGLCTYGFTGRALLHTVVGSDPARFTGMEGRFASPVLPGQTLDVSIWIGDGEAFFQTRVGDTVVLDAGRMTFTA